MIPEKDRKIIGRLEKIDIPSLGLENVTAKIDTGAYRGAIHANNVEEVYRGEDHFLRFELVDDVHPDLKSETYEVSDFQIKKFRGTDGKTQERYVIPLEIILGDERLNVELSLTDRTDMRYPILIGRRFLKKRFLVNVSKKNTKETKRQI